MNFKEFDSTKPETWVRGQDLLVKTNTGNFWHGAFEEGSQSDLFYTKVGRGHCVFAHAITHYCLPTSPDDQGMVGVPKGLSEETISAFEAIETDVRGYPNETMKRWGRYIQYLEGKAKQ